MVSLDQVRVLSVDLFDTLVLRSVAQPSEAFSVLATRAADEGLLPPHVPPAQFALLRRECEERARLRKHEALGTTEVSLADIYASLPPELLVDPAAVARLEVQVERDLVYAHPTTLALVREARTRGLHTALVSDTYFGQQELVGILAAADIPADLFDVILTSSDEGCSKHDGGLFARLRGRWPDISPTDILHVGDHPHADVHQARRAGLTAVQHDTGRREPAQSAMRLEALRHGRVLSELASLRGLACSLATGTDEQRWWFALGATAFGPTLSAFADWTVEACVRDGISTVRPIMREGALFSALIQNSAAATEAALDVAPLYASRSATWLAGLDRFDRDAVHRLLQRQHLTIAEALEGLGLAGHEGVAALSTFHDVTLGEAPGVPAGTGHSVASLLVDSLLDDDVRARVATTLSAERRRVQTYLDQACGDATDVALVDLGFHGSTGQAIERAARGGSPRRYHHFLVFAADGVARLWAEGSDVRVFAAGPADNADLAGAISRHPALLEALLIEGGTTLGYQTNEDRAAPLLGPNHAPLIQQAAGAECRAGILAFQSCWLDWRRRHPVPARRVLANRRALTVPIHRLITMPTADEASRLGAFVHEDNEGGRSVRRLAVTSAIPASLTPEAFLQATLSGGPAFGHTWLWPAGACEQRWPGYLEQRWREVAGTGDSAPPTMPAIAMRMRQAGVRECIVWGAGEAGAALIASIRQEGLDVLLVTDSNPALWGTNLAGVRVVSPAEAREHGNDIFAIGSCAFATDIERAVREHYEAGSEAVKVFSPVDEEVAA